MSRKDEVLDTIQNINREGFERLCLKVLENMGFEISNLKSVSGDILAEGSIERENETQNFIIKFTRSCEDLSSEIHGLKSFLSPSKKGLLFYTKKIDEDSYLDDRIEVVGGIKLYQLLERFNLLSFLTQFKDEKKRAEKGKQEDLIRKGDECLSEGNYEMAQKYYDEAKEMSDDPALALSKKGQAFLEQGKYERAIKLVKESLEINQEKVDSWILLGDSYDGIGRKKEALQAYNKALDLSENKLDILKKKGRTLYKMKRYDEAILCFEDVLELDSEAKEVWNNKALCHMRNGEYEESIESINNALSIDPDFEEALVNKALIFENMGEIQNALDVSKELVKSFPNKSEYYYFRGAYLTELERFDEALKSMSRAVELNPENERARVAISDIKRKKEE